MTKVVIIEDEPLFRADIAQLLESNFKDEISLAGAAHSVESGIALIQQHTPDLVLLDINLGDGNGFDLLERLENQNFALIFVTGFDNHAIKAIKVGALDYIMKPIIESEFVAGVRKALGSIETRSDLVGSRNIASQFYAGTSTNQFVVSTSEAMHVLKQEDIYFCAAEGNYTTFYTIEQKILVARPLKFYEDIFNASNFIRCHRSYVINKTHVSSYDKNGFLVMANGDKVPIATRKKNLVMKAVFG